MDHRRSTAGVMGDGNERYAAVTKTRRVILAREEPADEAPPAIAYDATSPRRHDGAGRRSATVTLRAYDAKASGSWLFVDAWSGAQRINLRIRSAQSTRSRRWVPAVAPPSPVRLRQIRPTNDCSGAVGGR